MAALSSSAPRGATAASTDEDDAHQIATRCDAHASSCSIQESHLRGIRALLILRTTSGTELAGYRLWSGYTSPAELASPATCQPLQ